MKLFAKVIFSTKKESASLKFNKTSEFLKILTKNKETHDQNYTYQERNKQ